MKLFVVTLVIIFYDFAKMFDTPINCGQKMWYPSKNSSTPVPSFKNDSSLASRFRLMRNRWHLSCFKGVLAMTYRFDVSMCISMFVGKCKRRNHLSE